MDTGARIRWIIVIVVMLIFVGLVTWGLFSIAQNLFNRTTGGNSAPESAQIEEDVNTLQTAAVATYEVNGPIVANEDHRSYVITVTNNNAEIVLYARYGAKVLDRKSYSNTQDAFDAFMASLAQEDVTAEKKNTTEELRYGEAGVCSSGRRYILEIDSLRRWSTSCSNKDGNADFSMGRVRSLFQRQIPDFNDVVRGSGL